jgi:hypothetical protein
VTTDAASPKGVGAHGAASVAPAEPEARAAFAARELADRGQTEARGTPAASPPTPLPPPPPVVAPEKAREATREVALCILRVGSLVIARRGFPALGADLFRRAPSFAGVVGRQFGERVCFAYPRAVPFLAEVCGLLTAAMGEPPPADANPNDAPASRFQ